MVALWVAGAAALAVADWVAVARGIKPLEYVCKPAVMAALVGAALAVQHPYSHSARWWFVVALVLSLAGDVFLMLPQDLFVPGLASFLLAHVAYVVGFRAFEIWAAAVVAVIIVGIGRPTTRAVWQGDDPALRLPVLVYIVAIAAMATAALSSHRAVAAVGALLFVASDATIAWNRFVNAKRWMPVFIIVTYHLGQAGLVLALPR